MTAPNVAYTRMIIDETSGHSWVTAESSSIFKTVEREEIEDARQIKSLKDEAQVHRAKDSSKHRYCGWLLKTNLGDKTVVKVLATARLYRKTGEKV